MMPVVREPRVLSGVDDIAWGELEHAYGAADDVPTRLRALVSGDADEAVGELFSSICYQGSVYPATVRAVPFLARIAAAGFASSGVLGLLGCIAQSDDEHGIEKPGSARAAVAGQADVLVGLLADRESEVRAMTVWALAQCRDPDELAPALRAHWDAEASTAVKATMLKALWAVGRAAGIAETQLASSGDPGLRLVAAGACVAAGAAWSGELADAGTAWMARGLTLPGYWWFDGNHPFGDLLTALAGRGDLDLAVQLATAGLTRDVGPGVRKDAVWNAGVLADGYRIPVLPLVTALGAVARDDDAGLSAISLLRRLGQVSGGQPRDTRGLAPASAVGLQS